MFFILDLLPLRSCPSSLYFDAASRHSLEQSTADGLPAEALAKAGVPDRTRTCDLRIRNPLLYPPELRALTNLEFQTACRAIALATAEATGTN